MAESGEIKIAPKLWIVMASIVMGGFVAGGSGDQVLAMIWPRQVEITVPQIDRAVEKAIEPIKEAVSDHNNTPFPAHPGGHSMVHVLNSQIVEVTEEVGEVKATMERKFNEFSGEQRRTNEKLDQLIGETRAMRREVNP